MVELTIPRALGNDPIAAAQATDELSIVCSSNVYGASSANVAHLVVVQERFDVGSRRECPLKAKHAACATERDASLHVCDASLH